MKPQGMARQYGRGGHEPEIRRFSREQRELLEIVYLFSDPAKNTPHFLRPSCRGIIIAISQSQGISLDIHLFKCKPQP